MKVLHVYPKSDELICRHVALLRQSMQHSATLDFADNASEARKKLREMDPDIVHCHGCWRYFVAHAALSGYKRGARVVLTPHGQLEPWIVNQQSVQAKVGKQLLWQRKAVERTYAVITLGSLEQQNFRELGWNSRTEVIRNAVTTNSITPQQMGKLTFDCYQKVMDSNTLELMSEQAEKLLAAIIKAGIMGDRRWVTDGSYPTADISDDDWRRLLVYAEHENIRNYVDYGITVLQLPTPAIDTTKISAYFPDAYTRPRPLHDIIGNYEGNESKYLMRMIRQISKQPLLLHLIELHRELHRDTVDDEKLAQSLQNHRLLTYAQGLIQVLSEQTQLDEGFMPLKPADNRMAKHIRKQITNHLKI